MKSNIGEQSTILVVDDDIHLLATLEETLNKHFSRVLTADRASFGLELVETQTVDCIITDYLMPEMNGLEFISQLSKKFPQIPVILMTGNGTDAAVIQAIENGLFDYLDKPINEFALLNRIRNALLLPKLESLVLEIAESEFPDVRVGKFLTQSPDERLKVISALEGVIRMRLQSKKTRKAS